MAVRANKPAFNIREKLKELTHSIGLKGRELMRAETVQEARDLISAGRKNIIINGDMSVSQRYGDGYSPNFDTGGKYIVDRFSGYNTHGVMRGVQSTVSPPGFSYSLKCDVTTADSPRTSSAWSALLYKLEGYDIAHLNWGNAGVSKPCTLSFWVRSSVTGKYSVHFRDSVYGNSFASAYIINEANVWEHKKVTIPPPSAGTYGTTNTMGFNIVWAFATEDTSYTTDTLDRWETSGNKFATNQMANLFSTIGDSFYLTGVQLEVGKNATEFEHRPYYEELALCQRYFWALTNPFTNNHNIIATGHGGSGNRVFAAVACPVAMRDYPNIWNKLVNVQDGGTSSNVTDRLYPNTLNELGGSANIINYGGYPNRTHLSLSITAVSTTNGNGYRVNVKNDNDDDGYLYFESEL